MPWLNEHEIDALRVTHPPLISGATFLRAFKDLINAISDGWAYWSYGTKCSADLGALLSLRGQAAEATTVAEVKKAKARVTGFLRRCPQTKHNPQVIEFLANNVP